MSDPNIAGKGREAYCEQRWAVSFGTVKGRACTGCAVGRICRAWAGALADMMIGLLAGGGGVTSRHVKYRAVS